MLVGLSVRIFKTEVRKGSMRGGQEIDRNEDGGKMKIDR